MDKFADRDFDTVFDKGTLDSIYVFLYKISVVIVQMKIYKKHYPRFIEF